MWNQNSSSPKNDVNGRVFEARSGWSRRTLWKEGKLLSGTLPFNSPRVRKVLCFCPRHPDKVFPSAEAGCPSRNGQKHRFKWFPLVRPGSHLGNEKEVSTYASGPEMSAC